MPRPILSLRGVAKRFVSRGRLVHALSRIDLDIEEGEFLSVVGPSGCGKSTLLNILVGLLPPSEGEIRYEGRPVHGLNPAIGYVTQQDNLLPWRTLRRNVLLPLELRHEPRGDREERAARLIRKVGLAGFEEHYPHELSGGMRQRANIIRTLIYDPAVILMDEPFGPLDAQTRLALQSQLLALWREARKTVVFITHDLAEAIALSDRVVLMSARPGRIKRVVDIPIARPRDVYHMHAAPNYKEIYELLWQDLREEVVEAMA
ncbi:MAG TPA: ABC transporter ATP-binding protein [Burkholderiales bacterium]